MEGKRQRLQRRLQGLKTVRSEWESHWRELSDFIEPRRSRFTARENRGQKLNKNIVDSTGTFALRTLKSGMMAGVTSPARPWFRFITQDPDLTEFGPVKEYLHQAETRMRDVFQGSNIYNLLHVGYGDIGLFGTAAGIIVADDEEVIRGHQFTTGEYWIAQDHRGVVDTLYRRLMMSAEQVVGRFVYRGNKANDPDWSVVSTTVKNLWDNGNYNEWIEVYAGIEPRKDRDPFKADNRNMPFRSVYWEEGQSREDVLLEESGHEENPIIAPRWEVTSEDVYGRSPGMDALPDVKALQVQQRRKAEGIDKTVRPPMVGTPQMKNVGASLLPGAITYVDDPTGKGFRAAIQVDLNLGDLVMDIRETQDRIRQAFFADLFLMMANSDRRQITAREIDERHEEKLLALGPVLERVHSDLLGPLIDRTFAIMERNGQLPPPPEELQGEDLKVDYISMLAQAQKAVATGSVDRLFAFGGNLAGIRPETIDKLNFDQAIDEYGDMLGVPPSLINSDDEVEKIRADRADAQAAAKNMEMAQAGATAARDGAGAAKLLSEASSQPGSADLLNRLGIGSAV